MSACPMELCPHWAGDGDVCPCAVFDLPHPVIGAVLTEVIQDGSNPDGGVDG